MNQASELLEQAKDEEQDSFDNLPEGLQGAEKGETMESNVGILEAAFDNLTSAIEGLEDIE